MYRLYQEAVADYKNQNVMLIYAKIITQIHEQLVLMLDGCRGREINNVKQREPIIFFSLS